MQQKYRVRYHMSRFINWIFAYAKTKAQISFAVTAKLISAFGFATRIVLFLIYLYPKFQDYSFLLRLYRLVCQTRSETPNTDFLASRLIFYSVSSETCLSFALQKSIGDDRVLQRKLDVQAGQGCCWVCMLVLCH